jgi:hypothetical protein
LSAGADWENQKAPDGAAGPSMTTIDFPSVSWPVTIRRDARDIGKLSFEKFLNQDSEHRWTFHRAEVGDQNMSTPDDRGAESPIRAAQEGFIEFCEV